MTELVESTISPRSRTSTYPASARTPTSRTRRVRTEGNWILTAPLWVLSFLAIFAGFVNVPHFEKFEEFIEPRYAFVDVNVAKFNVIVAIISG